MAKWYENNRETLRLIHPCVLPPGAGDFGCVGSIWVPDLT